MVAHQRRTFGCVQRMRKDVYRLRWMDKGRRRSMTVYGTRREAERKLAEIRAATDECAPPMRTVGEIYESLVRPEQERNLAPRTLENKGIFWRKHVSPRWASLGVDEVLAGDVQAWLLTLAPEPAKKSLAILRDVMRHALMLELIRHSPLEISFEMPTAKSREHSREIIHDAATLDAYIAAVRGTFAEGPVILMACGGLRVGESLGVMVGEVERRTAKGQCAALVRVARQALPSGGVATNADGTERMKTSTSDRHTAIVGAHAERLLEIQADAAKRGHAFIADDGTGNPIGTAALRGEWARRLKAAGLPKIVLRNLRPTFATAAHFGDGLATEDVARLMGHAKPTITYGTYQRPDGDDIMRIFE